MTDRCNSLLVVLDRDVREDDIESTIEAIKHIKGVIAVKMRVADMTEYLAIERARQELGQKILRVIYPKEKA